MAPMKRPAAAKTGAALRKMPKTASKTAKTAGKAPSAPPEKPVQELDPIAQKCEQVAKAVLDTEGFPAQVLEMLSGALPASLSVVKEDRHRCHEKVLEMVSQVLSAAEESLMVKINRTEAKVGEADSEKASRQSALETAKATETASTETLAAAKAARDEAFDSQEAAKESLKALIETQKVAEQELSVTIQRADALEAVQSGVFEPLRTGSVASEEVQTSLEKLAACGKDFAFDPSLLSSLPGALTKAPDARGSFDVVVVDQIDGEFKKHIAILREKISCGTTAGTEHAAQIAAAQATVTAAEEKLTTTATSVKEAQAAFKESQLAARAAMQATRSFGLEMEEAATELQEFRGKLEALREGPLAVYKELCERSATPPTPAPGDGPTASADTPSDMPVDASMPEPTKTSEATEATAMAV